MTDILNFLSQHIFTIHLEMGFVPTQPELPQAADNLVDLRAYNELQHEVPDFVEYDEDELKLRRTAKAKLGFK